MRVFGPAAVVSVALWASIAWCFVALLTMAGHNHFQLNSRHFGAYLLGIDAAFGVALVWYTRMTPRDS